MMASQNSTESRANAGEPFQGPKPLGRPVASCCQPTRRWSSCLWPGSFRSSAPEKPRVLPFSGFNVQGGIRRTWRSTTRCLNNGKSTFGSGIPTAALFPGFLQGISKPHPRYYESGWVASRASKTGPRRWKSPPTDYRFVLTPNPGNKKSNSRLVVPHEPKGIPRQWMRM